MFCLSEDNWLLNLKLFLIRSSIARFKVQDNENLNVHPLASSSFFVLYKANHWDVCCMVI